VIFLAISLEQISSPDTQSRIILYTAADGKVTADVFFAKETFWLTQRTMAELFGITIPSISRHLKNIYESQELSPDSTVSKIETVQTEGERQVTREIEVYNLDAVIAVGYRVHQSGTQRLEMKVDVLPFGKWRKNISIY
jgi:hypothetical protein